MVMKIGIMSYWNTSHNYGQVIQCFAMQQFLRDLGHQPFHIRYILGHKSLRRKLSEFSKVIFRGHFFDWRRLKKEESQDNTNATALELDKIQLIDSKKNPRRFEEFKKKYLAFSDKTYTFDELIASAPYADALIAGSDQIWCYPDPGYFLNFGAKGTLRIAYAPSFGGIKTDNALRKAQYKDLIKRLDILTVRESGGVDLCRSLEFNQVEQVPDPSFLLTPDQYRKIEAKEYSDSDYLFLYLLGNPIEISTNEIFKWAKEHNLKVKYVEAQGRNDNYPKLYPNVDEWIGLIDNAKYVITNSFHGMAMSIILNRKFLVIPVSKGFSRMNGRITDTLTHLNLTTRIFSGDFNDIFNNIDYPKVNEILSTDRDHIKAQFNSWMAKAGN